MAARGTKRGAVPSVAYAIAKAQWNAADPATRGPHPVDAAAVRNGGTLGSRSPWRKGRAGVGRKLGTVRT